MRLFCLPLLLLLTYLPATSQENEIVQPSGRIEVTILNDDGEPVKNASVCLLMQRPDHSNSHCGLVTDQNGNVQIDNVEMGKVGVHAEVPFGGYWEADTGHLSRMKTVTFTPKSRHVTLRIGPRPGVLNVALRDKVTGEFVSSAMIHLGTASHEVGSAGTAHFEHSESSELRVPIPPTTDVVLEVTATGYKPWVYTDDAMPSLRTLRLESNEQRSLHVELEPDPDSSAH